MKRRFTKYEEAISLMKKGWGIYTDRGFGGAPYNPLFFNLHKNKQEPKPLHHSTVASLIKKGIITNPQNGHPKYALITPPTHE